MRDQGTAGPPEARAEALRDQTIVLDCRYLGMGGAGRVTELLLREFRGSPPPGRWVLWGRREQIEVHAFPGAEHSVTEVNPIRMWGQRASAAVPKCDVAIYLHQIRPLRPGRSITVIHDTIPIRFGGPRLERAMKRQFFKLAARLSAHVLTDSPFSKSSINGDLGVPLDRITVMRFPVDLERARRIWELRKTTEQQDALLYIGRFDEHKNLRRLCQAYRGSGFAARGGRLLLVGGWEGEVEPLRNWVNAEGIGATEIHGPCSEAELDRLLASSRALIMPSLEEGYGLPAFEAAASGLPVAASTTGAMTELPPSAAVHFDPRDTGAMTHAIDEATGRVAGEPAAFQTPYLGEAVLSAVQSALGAKGVSR